MAFDQQTRNRLARFVSEARALLSAEFTRQLQNDFGLNPATGEAAGLDKLPFLNDTQRETARLLRATLDHYLAGSDTTQKARRDALDRIVREQAFTVLNRLCALRMAEARGLLIESIGRGYQSKGFQLYARLAGAGLGETGDAWRVYLFSVCDEFAVDLPVLFDRYNPQGRLFPREGALLALLDLINHPDIDPLWAEDETIGWIYQYFNSKEERKAMREASQAPRNSRELAVRNQFFTPRYVVEFLTDNTLGRIWHEMTQGETALKDTCRYLVRRPNEIFLGEGVPAPLPACGERLGEGSEAELSQEELLRQPVFIPHRPMKDPRELKMLDPACGSMHFGLYAFDLFERIYEEAWEREQAAGGGALTADFPDRDAFLREVPRLIIERNIHGIDIDPRAVQIAGLSLWLRAQKRWHDLGVRAGDRPRIRRSNVVCAEPMPGEQALLEEFIKQSLSGSSEDRAVAGIVRRAFEAMALAGEAGSLLKIEEEIAGAIDEARQQWLAAKTQPRQAALLREAETPYQTALGIDVRGITDEAFWEEAEERIYVALRAYAEQGEGDAQRRLFAEDAARGFAFIDLCRQRYDVVLMNPPFGEAANFSKEYVKECYENSATDVFQSFVERGLGWLKRNGREGVISARTGFFLGNSKYWRENVVFKNRLTCFADLGLGVLDDALVEVASYVIEQGDPTSNKVLTHRQLSTRDKSQGLLNAVLSTFNYPEHGFSLFDQQLIVSVPDYTFAYWAPAKFLKRYAKHIKFGKAVSRVRQGIATADDFRFGRLGWEVDYTAIGGNQRWQRFSKGGEYSPLYDDIHLLIDWKHDGSQLKAYPGCFIRNDSYYFKPGATYTVRTASAFAPKVLPAGCIFSHNAQSWFSSSNDLTLLSIGYLTCRVPQAFIELAVGSGDIATAGSVARRYTTAVIESVPANVMQKLLTHENLEATLELYKVKVAEFASGETSIHYSVFHIAREISLRSAEETRNRIFITDVVNALHKSGRLDAVVLEEFKLSDEENRFVDSEVGIHPTIYTGTATSTEVNRLFQLDEESLMAEAVAKHGSKRWFTKKSYFVNRCVEIICHHLSISPSTFELLLRDTKITSRLIDSTKDAVSEIFGAVLGRWDIRYATGERPAPALPDPFDPLPVCPPGMLQNAQGLPATPADVPADYPLRISWSGILCDDAGHPEDIEARARDALQVLWGARADAIEQEACDILGVKVLREYFRKPALFFADHLKRYSKSRRQAPIYWPLSTPAGSYTLWLYYHRLTDQTLYTCVNDFVEPKLRAVSAECAVLSKKNGRSAKEERELEQLTALMRELQDFRAELLRVAAFWKPNLNDGVQITAAPLWRLFGHKPWQKKLRETWDALEAGDYDWAHLAYSIWPERVREKCKADKSLAIAHDLEQVYVEPPASAKRAKKTPASKKKNLTEDMFDAEDAES